MVCLLSHYDHAVVTVHSRLSKAAEQPFQLTCSIKTRQHVNSVAGVIYHCCNTDFSTKSGKLLTSNGRGCATMTATTEEKYAKSKSSICWMICYGFLHFLYQKNDKRCQI